MLDSDEAHDSFTAWVDGRRDRLLRSTYMLTGDVGRAEDLLQEALVKVARRWNHLRETNADAYIRRVIYHDHVSWWRSRREVPVSEVIEVASDKDWTAREHGLVMEQALARLTRKQRAVIVLRYVDDVTEVEAAQALGVSVGTVKSQTAAAVRRLRDQAPELMELMEDGERT